MVTKLHQILRPFLLRRLKADVEIDIPAKHEYILFAWMTEWQSEMYADLIAKNLSDSSGKQVHRLAPPTPPPRAPPPPRRHAAPPRCAAAFFCHPPSPPRPPPSTARAPSLPPLSAAAPAQMRLNNVLMQLRKCCNHPYLFEWPLDNKGHEVVDDIMLQASGKMQLLDRILHELIKRQGDHQVLIFSQMTVRPTT